MPKILTPTLICHCVHDDILQVYSFYIHLKYVCKSCSVDRYLSTEGINNYLFSSFGNELMESCSVWCVSLASSASMSSVYSCPSQSFDHRDFIFYKYMHIFSYILLVFAYKIFCHCGI